LRALKALAGMYCELLLKFLALMTTCLQSSKAITSVRASTAERQRHQTYRPPGSRARTAQASSSWIDTARSDQADRGGGWGSSYAAGGGAGRCESSPGGRGCGVSVGSVRRMKRRSFFPGPGPFQQTLPYLILTANPKINAAHVD
jgi:hypothetical protein